MIPQTNGIQRMAGVVLLIPDKRDFKILKGSHTADKARKDTGSTPMEPEVVTHQIRITLRRCNVKSLEKVCTNLVRGTKEKNLKVKGPVQIPTKTPQEVFQYYFVLVLGAQTWNHFQIKIHRRLIGLYCPSEIVKQITSISTEPGVEVEVTIADV
ncbi:40S ribosomal protein S20-like [Molossus molossus]|uniref:40S ribosomal protein S20-like n=1 Tax=Molossus molossus TaxID=27622 RepID=UPI001747517D|nr:40S ribosomal protein S20-like [Molossus molossus]